MKVAIAAPSPVDFLIGGAEKLFMGMLSNLNQLSTHDIELIKIPCKDQDFWALMEGYKKFSKLDLDHFDMVITTKYPAWMIKHHNHIIYTQHTCRGVYDLYRLSKKSADWKKTIEKDSRLNILDKIFDMKDRLILEDLFGELEHLRAIEKSLSKRTFEFPGSLTRKIIHFLDSIAFLPDSPSHPYGIKSYCAISKNVAQRKQYFPKGVNVKIIHHPSNLENLSSKSHDFIFTASRLESLKRIDILIKAFKEVKSSIRFLIAGTGSQQSQLKELAKKDDRIEFLGFITDKELIDYYSKALFVPFIPFDEDYGLITIEAMKSKKAVLTTSDSGGVNEFVKNNFNGIIADPDKDSLCRAMQYLVDHKEETIKMGENAYQAVSHINWDNMAVSLLGKNALKESSAAAIKLPETITVESGSSYPAIIILSTFSIYPPVSGGKLRLYNLYKNLSKNYKVTILSLGHSETIIKISENFTEIKVKRTREFNRLAKKIKAETGVSSDDIAAIEGYKLIPGFEKKLKQIISSADAVILAHPYLYNAVSKIKKPVFYDAPNVEYILKSSMFNNEKYLLLVKSIEQNLCNRAKLIYPASKQDMDLMKKFYNISEKKFFIVENGVDTKNINILSPKEKKELKKRLGIKNRNVAVFAGSMHKPNNEAVVYMETLAKNFPDVIFIVIGGAGDVLKKSPKNLIPVGIVTKEDKDVLMRASDIGLNPVVSGSGTNLKLVEYLAYGLVVISTSFGARGIEYKDELFTCEIENFKEEFGHMINKLEDLDDMRKKARLLSEKYDWEKISLKLKNRLRLAIDLKSIPKSQAK
ncbi:MAG: glycosyltransferase family 4 protein [Desulfobacterales bacterium]|nr:glycosyltransferase family 4 protein [Desulfobacterales bacterium]